ncbi:MAG: putative sliding-clamp-loader subunit [Prokaryotic dsDNA virus sp.]|nr:MAG: putative sliding-clamp-loader subunit [Prokaryotic dsDNA virus sp.]|tara:strand:- start:21615 stop:22529 length:915 start_codon:yes stop_codon:yes gene_type:complete
MTSPVWFEKYRPTDFAEIVGQDLITEEMRNIANGKNPMNHFLFHSVEAGTGKTTVAYALAHQMDYALHIFNASSKRTRGIDFIEEDIIPLSQSGMWETIILLDEADRLTIQAQDALKGVIENATCFFILTCNDLSKVSPWLQSRCQLRHFKPIPRNSVINRLQRVASAEHLFIPESHLHAIASRHKGDLRNALGCLQAYATMQGVADRDRFILSLDIGDFNPKSFLRVCAKERSVEVGYKMIKDMPMRIIIRETLEYAVNSDASAEGKMRIIESSIISERDLLQGCDETIVRWDYCRMLAARDL